MNAFFRSPSKVCGLLFLLLVVSWCGAEMIIITHDGQSFQVPVNQADIKEIRYSADSSISGGHWKLKKVDAKKPDMKQYEPVVEFQFPGTDGSCECFVHDPRFGNLLKVKYTWTKLPSQIRPGELFPITFQVQVLDKKGAPGAFNAFLDGQLEGQGWAMMDNPNCPAKTTVAAQHPAGTVLKFTNNRHKSFAKGSPGSTMFYDIFAQQGGAFWQFRYTFEWVE